LVVDRAGVDPRHEDRTAKRPRSWHSSLQQAVEIRRTGVFERIKRNGVRDWID
jgi:hypothetical protein